MAWLVMCTGGTLHKRNATVLDPSLFLSVPLEEAACNFLTVYRVIAMVLPDGFTRSSPSPGPRGDYAIVVCAASGGLGMATSLTQGASIDSANSPIRPLANIAVSAFTESVISAAAARVNAWMPRDNFSFVSDGLSNQLLLGEKHIPTSKIGMCESTTQQWDCGIFHSEGSNGGLISYGRDIYRSAAGTSGVNAPPNPFVIAGNPSLNDNLASAAGAAVYQFGGTHPGICNFVLGDGSVRSVSATTNPEILRYLGDGRDGNAVSLP